MYRIACVRKMCIELRIQASATVDETRHGVRDVVVNVRRSPIEQTIYVLKNSCLNISCRLRIYTCSLPRCNCTCYFRGMKYLLEAKDNYARLDIMLLKKYIYINKKIAERDNNSKKG